MRGVHHPQENGCVETAESRLCDHFFRSSFSSQNGSRWHHEYLPSGFQGLCCHCMSVKLITDEQFHGTGMRFHGGYSDCFFTCGCKKLIVRSVWKGSTAARKLIVQRQQKSLMVRFNCHLGNAARIVAKFEKLSTRNFISRFHCCSSLKLISTTERKEVTNTKQRFFSLYKIRMITLQTAAYVTIRSNICICLDAYLCPLDEHKSKVTLSLDLFSSPPNPQWHLPGSLCAKCSTLCTS